jgi:ABC-type transport system involved in multi-copper enzyme maturation permease subunit
MVATIKAEFRKLLTTRSTYGISIFALLLVGFIALYGMGYKGWEDINGPTALQNHMFNALSIYEIFIGIIAILLIAHEYRYNTIMYSLTISNSRLKLLLAKMSAIAIFTAIFTAIAVVLTFLELIIGIKLGGHTMMTQQVDVWSVIWRSLAYMCGGALAGLVIGFLTRSVVFAIVAFFIIPTTVETLLITLLKVDANYLPFSAQGQIIMSGGGADVFTPLASAGVFGAYLLGAWIIATILFVKRDAN